MSKALVREKNLILSHFLVILFSLLWHDYEENHKKHIQEINLQVLPSCFRLINWCSQRPGPSVTWRAHPLFLQMILKKISDRCVCLVGYDYDYSTLFSVQKGNLNHNIVVVNIQPLVFKVSRNKMLWWFILIETKWELYRSEALFLHRLQ